MTLGLQKEVAGSERSPFYIDELIRGRRTKRGFTNKAVPIDLVRDILSISKFAPSSSNTQPWQCYVLTGKARERVVAAAVKAFNDNPEGLIPEYPFFPDPLHEPHLETFTKFRGLLGDAQGVERNPRDGNRLLKVRLFEKEPTEDFSAQVAVGRKEIGAFRQICEYRAGLNDCATVVDHQRRDSREPANLAEVWPVSVASSQIQSNVLVPEVELRQ
jgi:nitroreductase